MNIRFTLLFAILLLPLAWACKKTEVDEEFEVDRSVIGEWYSSRGNLSEIMKEVDGVDSVFLVFRTDSTYYIETFGELYTTNRLVIKTYHGKYRYFASDFGGIHTISLDQSKPSVLALEGIFEVTTTSPPYTMHFEVLQVEPFVNLYPPTPEGGFGSSDGGSFQNRNIQKYVKIKNLE